MVKKMVCLLHILSPQDIKAQGDIGSHMLNMVQPQNGRTLSPRITSQRRGDCLSENTLNCLVSEEGTVSIAEADVTSINSINIKNTILCILSYNSTWPLQCT